MFPAMLSTCAGRSEWYVRNMSASVPKAKTPHKIPTAKTTPATVHLLSVSHKLAPKARAGTATTG